MQDVNIKTLIEDICEKYNIGKTALSLVLGLGEKTLFRYIKQSTCKDKSKEMLLRVYKDPFFLKEYVEKNKDLLSNVAYKKVKLAIENQMENSFKENYKISWILEYYLSHNKELSIDSLKIILYYTNGFMKSLIKKDLVDLNICITEDSIIIPKLENIIAQKHKECMENKISKKMECDYSRIGILEFVLVESITKGVLCYSNQYIKNMMWSSNFIQEELKTLDKNEARIISQNKIDKYFDDLVREHEMYSPEDIIKYTMKKHEEYLKG